MGILLIILITSISYHGTSLRARGGGKAPLFIKNRFFAIVTGMHEEQLHAIRHSLAHLLAMAAREKDANVKLAIGPVIENGFYYDFEFSENISLAQEDLKGLQKAMKKLGGRNLPFTGKEVTVAEARTLFSNEPYKLELIDEFAKEGKKLTVYETGGFTDLCRGGHVENTKEIDLDAFAITHTAGAYWRGDEKNTMLTRIYGLAFESKEKLDAYLKQQEEAKKRDHKKLGKELDLFFIDEEVGRGFPMWTPKGTAVKFALEEFTRNLERKYGYDHVVTPYLGSEKLYATSGHLEHYKENMYAPIVMDGDIFYLRPMACPHHIRMLLRKPLSYKDLPVRYAEIADYNRPEKSGELMGMIRLRKFQLTDAHIFVSPEGLREEFKNVCSLMHEAMTKLGIAKTVSYRFSKRDPNNKHKYYPDDNLWNKGESVMKEVLDEIGFPYTEAEDEAAFYGPKLDVQARNVNGKEDTLFTAQIDFLLPEKFNITYTDSDGAEKRPVMIHRSAIGSLERTFAFLIEHYGGAFPAWLAPVQVAVMSISEKHNAYAREIFARLKKQGFRAELHDENESLGKKIRMVKTHKLPYFLVVGDEELASGTVMAESRDDGKLGAMDLEKFSDLLIKEQKQIYE